MRLNVLSAKWRPFCLSLNVLNCGHNSGMYYLITAIGYTAAGGEGILRNQGCLQALGVPWPRNASYDILFYLTVLEW